MILIINLCQEKLSSEEFIRPLEEIVKNRGEYHIKFFKEKFDPSSYQKIIIGGTALKDFYALNYLSRFFWLKKTKTPLLGICLGMQILGLVWGARLIPQKEIGLVKIKTLKKNPLFSGELRVYALHSCSLENLKEFDLLAKSDQSVHAIKKKKKPFYGLLFHPEVKNKEIIERFLELPPSSLS